MSGGSVAGIRGEMEEELSLEGAQMKRCTSYLLLHNKSPQNMAAGNKSICNLRFWGLGIQVWVRGLPLVQGFSWSCRQALGWGAAVSSDSLAREGCFHIHPHG